METRRRSIAKALSWRILASLITVVIAWFITGQFAVALEISAFDLVAKLGAYYYHERAWLKITYGREAQKPEYQI